MADDTPDLNPIELATELTIAWLGNPNTRAASDDVPAFLNQMHEAVLQLTRPVVAEPSGDKAAEYTPATTVRRSLASKDHIISLIDGKPYKTLRRHLSTHGLTPADYRQRYNLKPDYPIVAANYSEARRAMAQKIGLGRKGQARKAPSSSDGSAVSAPPARPGRKPKASSATDKPVGRRGRPPKVAPAPSPEE